MEEIIKKIIDRLGQLQMELSEVAKEDDPRKALILENQILDKHLSEIYKTVEPKNFIGGLWQKGEEGIKEQLPNFPFRDKVINSCMEKLQPLKNNAIILKNCIKEKTSLEEKDNSIRVEVRKIIDKYNEGE